MASPTTPLKARAEKSGDSPWSTVRFLLVLALLAWIVRSFIVAPFSIPSGSMLPTLYIGDYLIVAKWPYGYARVSFPLGIPSFDGRIFGDLPKRGDVVVFRHPSGGIDLIKRVVGLPGDTVAVDNGRLILNGEAVRRQKLRDAPVPISRNSPCRTPPPTAPEVAQIDGRDYCLHPAYRETLPNGRSYTVLDQVDNGNADNLPPTRVPPGHVFLMGDNRDDSLDSRFSAAEGGVGLVPADHLIGRALVTFWSTDGSASYLKPWTWFTALRANRIGNRYTAPAQ